jgi:hypothetical protein
MDCGALLPQADPSITSKSGGRGGWPAALFLIGTLSSEFLSNSQTPAPERTSIEHS